MHLLVTLAGIALTGTILFDAFVTIVLPRTVTTFRPSTYFHRSAWDFWVRVAGMIREPTRRQGFFSIFGPLSVLMLLAFWGLALMVGFALLHWGLRTQFFIETQGRSNLGNILYFSGTTFLTLGLGDIAATNPLGRALTVLEAATGFVSLAVVVGYLPLLEQAYSNRETRLVLFGLRCGSPLCAGRFLQRYGKASDRDKLGKVLHDGEEWIAELLQNQLSHPVLAYYRSQHLNQSWLGSLVTFLDLSVLLQTATDRPLVAPVKTSFLMALHALVEMGRAMKVSPIREGSDRLRDEDFERLRGLLEKVGIFYPAGPAAAQAVRELRGLYEPHAAALARKLKLHLPVWLPPEEAEDDDED